MEGRSQGGIGSVVQTLGRALVRKGHRVSVAGIRRDIDKSVRSSDEGVELHFEPAANWPVANFYPNVRKLLRLLEEIHTRHPVDIVEGSELAFAFFPKRFFAKKVIRMHGGHHFFAVTLGKKPALWRGFQEKRSFANADALIAVSRFVGETTRELLGFSDAFEVIYNIVDTRKFYEADPDKVEAGRLLFVGTVTEKKGIRQLVQAMPAIRGAVPRAHLRIVGRDWNDPKTGASYTEYLRGFIADEVRDAVEIVGALPHDAIPAELEKAEVCIYPSHMEAQGVVVVEAMAMAKPTIFSIYGPGKEMISHGNTGLLCDPFDPEDIAEKVIAMLQNPEEAARMGKRAREDILRRFDPDATVERNIAFYRSLL